MRGNVLKNAIFRLNSDDIYVWVLASTRALLEEKKKKKKKKKKLKKIEKKIEKKICPRHYLSTIVFELSKNIVPIKSYASFLASPYI